MTTISFGGRHLVRNDETLTELLEVIVPRTVEAKQQGGPSVSHRLIVNAFLDEDGQAYIKRLDELRKELHGEGVRLDYQQGRGPGFSFYSALMQRDADVTVLYGAEDIDVRAIQPEEAPWFAREMSEGDIALGVGCRPQVMLHDQVPEADVMRQLHEVYYAIAAGAREGLRPENPFDHDLSKAPSVFAGVNGVGGFGDLTTGLAFFNHNASGASSLANFFSRVTRTPGVDPEFFASEYAFHIHAGAENTFRIYTAYNKNKFYGEKTEPTDDEREAAMEKVAKSTLDYNRQLAKIPEVYAKLIRTVEDPATKPSIRRNISSYKGFTKIASPEELLERVDGLMRQGLSLDSE